MTMLEKFLTGLYIVLMSVFSFMGVWTLFLGHTWPAVKCFAVVAICVWITRSLVRQMDKRKVYEKYVEEGSVGQYYV